MSSFTGKVISAEGAEWSCFFVSSTGKGQNMITLLIIRPVALSGHGAIAIDPWPLRAKGLIVLVSPNYSDRKKQ